MHEVNHRIPLHAPGHSTLRTDTGETFGVRVENAVPRQAAPSDARGPLATSVGWLDGFDFSFEIATP